MTSRSVKQFVAAGGAALVLGVAALGVAAAQQTPTVPTSPGPTQTRPAGTPGQQGAPRQDRRQELLNSVANKLGIPVDRLQQAFTDARRELGIPDRPAGELRGGPGGPDGFGPRGAGIDLMAAAQAMNLQPDQLRQELPGKSLADVARAHDVDPTTVANALKNQASQRIDQAATNGRIAADQVATAKQEANQRIDQLMTQQLPAMDQQRGPGRPFGPGQPGDQRGGGQQSVPGGTTQLNNISRSA